MKSKFKYLFLSLLSVSLAGCSMKSGDYYYAGAGAGRGGDGGYVDPGYYGDGGSATGAKSGAEAGSAPAMMGDEGDKGGESGDVTSEAPETPKSSRYVLPAGQLTCSALDDNNAYDYWKEITSRGQEGQGALYQYRSIAGNNFYSYNRVKLTVNNANDVYITLKDDNKTFHVDNFHNAYLFPKQAKESYQVNISYLDKDNNRQNVEKTVKDNDVIDLENEYTTASNLEVMFVIDATGSMGDEMRYIKSEIDDVIGKVKEDNPTSKVSLAMMVYRDTKDEYVTRYSDFTEDIASQKAFLSKQSASGGGDFEEAVDTALDEAVNKQWSSRGTKLIFHVADAPGHDKDLDKWSKAVDTAAEKGINIISVAASGIDKKTEFYFRSQSIITGGQYVFLTDDSGIGNSHEVPTIKDKLVVEYLNDCLIRLIDGYHSGDMKEPVPYNQVYKQ